MSWLRDTLRKWLNGPPAEVIEPPKTEEEARRRIQAEFAAGDPPLTPIPRVPPMTARQTFAAAKPMAGVMPDQAMAMDAGLPMASTWEATAAFNAATQNIFGAGVGFLGYPYLAELSQIPEYRRISEIPAEEMTRKWIAFKSKSGDDKSERIEALAEACEKYKLRDMFRIMAELDGLFGRAQLYIDIKDVADKPDELVQPLVRDKRKVAKGSLNGFLIIEPLWSYPLQYNSDNPLKSDFFVPQTWSVQGKIVHRTRLLTFIGRPMPDLLKPAYAFGGLSLSQMAMPYVNNWLRTRQSVSDMIHSFSVMILKTDLGTTLDVGAMNDLMARIQMMISFRDNRGVQVVGEDEEFSNVSAPLSGLHELQAQSQEQMAAVAQIPLVKLLGITPSGLNASSDGEIRVFYDHVKAGQEKFFSDNLAAALDVIQLSEFGEIDPDIVFEFVPLWEMDEAAQAAINKSKADTDAVYVESGVIDQDEVRNRLKSDPKSGYDNLSGNAPEIEMDPDNDDEGISGNPAKSAETRGEERSGV